jgi:nicotinamide-nucleotide amidase
VIFPAREIKRAANVVALCKDLGLTLTTAESCTGGLLSALITEASGASEIFGRGFTTYENAAKTALLGVPEDMISVHGAVSAEVAEAMATGALQAAGADLSVAITGVAGPNGGTEAKPVGLVHVATARRGGTVQGKRFEFGAIGRSRVRLQSVTKALQMIQEALSTSASSALLSP